MKKRILTLVCILALLVAALGIAAAAEADVITLNENLETYEVTKDTYLNLNGYSIENVTVNEGVSLYVFDKETDDYTVADGKYGKIAEYTGNVSAAEGYAKIESDGYSFHKVDLSLTSMSLRADEAGLYCKSSFLGDEVVAENVKTFGVAMSIKGEPTEQNLKDTCAYSSFAGSKFATGEATSTLLKGIMKERNGYLVNNANATTLVYAKAYIQLQDGSYVFGECQSRNMKDQVEAIADEAWEKLSAEQQKAVVSMYRKFSDVMDQWSVTKVEAATLFDKDAPVSTDKSSLKILAITSSFGMNTTELLYEVAKSYGYEDVVVARLYGSGCPLERHVDNAINNHPFYMYTKKDDTGYRSEYDPIFPEGKKDGEGNWTVEGATLQYGLEDEDWDIIYVQQSASSSGYLPSYQNYVDQLMDFLKANTKPGTKFVWNMTWAFQEGASNAAFSRYFKNDQMFMYQSLVDVLQTKIISRTDFDAVSPTGTAIQNARTSYFGDNLCIDWRDDLIHLNTLGRVIAAHTLFATLTGQPLEEIVLTEIAQASTPETRALTLTEQDKLVILEAVNNALADPFHVTQSVYTESN